MSGVLGSTTMMNLVPACQIACQTEVSHKGAHCALEWLLHPARPDAVTYRHRAQPARTSR